MLHKFVRAGSDQIRVRNFAVRVFLAQLLGHHVQSSVPTGHHGRGKGRGILKGKYQGVALHLHALHQVAHIGSGHLHIVQPAVCGGLNVRDLAGAAVVEGHALADLQDHLIVLLLKGADLGTDLPGNVVAQRRLKNMGRRNLSGL